MNSALISVIVPVYNVERYLKMCIESIIHQQYKNLEIILVDDGSTDLSGNICDDYAKLDKRITVIHKPNGGLSDARNVGMEYAHGQLLGFVDSDDWIDPNMYLDLYNAMVQHNSEITVCNRILVQGNQYIYDECDGDIHVRNKQDALELLLENTKCPSHAWNKLYKKEVFNNISFPVGKYYEDVYIMHIIFENAQSVTFIEKPLYYYRQRDDSIVHMKNMKGYYDLMEAVKLRYERYKDQENFAISIAQIQVACLFLLNSLQINKSEKRISSAIIKKYYNDCCLKKFRYLPIKTVMKRRLLITFPIIVSMRHNTLIKAFLNFLRGIVVNRKISASDQESIERLRQSHYKKRAILLGSPEGNNLGDLAIGYSIKNYFFKYFPEVDFYEISEKCVICNLKKIKHFIRTDDILLLIGGGNFGDLYMDQQKIRLSVLKNFPHNKIVQFPQSWLFTDKKSGEIQLNKISSLLKKANSVTLFAREEFSYKLFVKHFQKTDIKMVPDIVLSNSIHISSKKEDILICLRGDIESRLDVQTRLEIVNICTQYGHVECWDTFVPKVIGLDIRDKEVLAGINYVGKHKLMVTDRFHGIIFAVITGTPCIAISNNNQKIKGLIKLLNICSIKLMSDISQLPGLISAALEKYPNGSQKQLENLEFSPLRECIESAAHEMED